MQTLMFANVVLKQKGKRNSEYTMTLNQPIELLLSKILARMVNQTKSCGVEMFKSLFWLMHICQCNLIAICDFFYKLVNFIWPLLSFSIGNNLMTVPVQFNGGTSLLVFFYTNNLFRKIVTNYFKISWILVVPFLFWQCILHLRS